MRGISTVHGASALLACSVLLTGCEPAEPVGESLTAPALAVNAVRIDPYFNPVNKALADMGSPYRVSEVRMHVIGAGRSDNRILQLGTRWVPGDPNRFWSTEGGSVATIHLPSCGAQCRSDATPVRCPEVGRVRCLDRGRPQSTTAETSAAVVHAWQINRRGQLNESARDPVSDATLRGLRRGDPAYSSSRSIRVNTASYTKPSCFSLIGTRKMGRRPSDLCSSS